jgi:SAM-dependent methyltransferase
MARTHYANVTIRDPNIIKRKLHRIRYGHALLSMKKFPDSFSGNIFDYGGGNGELCKYIISGFPGTSITMYEPAPDIRSEAVSNLEKYPGIKIVGGVSDIPSYSFDMIFCLAVFEHLHQDDYNSLFNDFNRLLKQDGILVIGVPVEIYIPALIKGIFRMTRRYGNYDANISNVLRCFIGKPPKNRPLSHIDVSLPFYWDHLGFDHRVFQGKLASRFKIVKIYGSPLPIFLNILNFDKYYVCKK